MSTGTRKLAPHVTISWELWNLATISWEQSREEICNGWNTEESEFAERFPAPRFRDYLVDVCAALRHDKEMSTV